MYLSGDANSFERRLHHAPTGTHGGQDYAAYRSEYMYHLLDGDGFSDLEQRKINKEYKKRAKTTVNITIND